MTRTGHQRVPRRPSSLSEWDISTPASTPHTAPNAVLTLQRTIGNRATQQVLQRVAASQVQRAGREANRNKELEPLKKEDYKKRFRAENLRGLSIKIKEQGWLGKGFLGAYITGNVISGTSEGLTQATKAASGVAPGVDVVGGLAGTFGGLTGVIEIFVAGLSTVRHLVALAAKDSRKAELGSQITQDLLRMAKGFLSTANGVIRAVNGFCSMAGQAVGEIVPILGPAVNILIQFIDVVKQTIEIVRNAIKIHKARMLRNKIDLMRTTNQSQSSSQQGSQDRQDMLAKLYEINQKRIYRAIRPLTAASVTVLADAASIGASVLKIIGVATSPAYGAGVGVMAAGYATSAVAGVAKLGAAASSPIASIIRMTKQKLRNFAGNTDSTKLLRGRKALGKIVNIEKTSEKKKEKDVKVTKEVLNLLGSLPPYKENDSSVETLYEEAYTVLKATGVDTKLLFQTTKLEEQASLIVTAIRRRE